MAQQMNKTFKHVVSVLTILFISGTATHAQSFLEKSLVAKSKLHNPIWTRNDPESSVRIDHSPWDMFLSTYVLTDANGVNRLKYASVTPQDKTALDAYILSLAKTDVTTLNRDEQYAFWLNLYNAIMVQTILANYPVSSVLKIKNNPLDLKGPFNDEVVRVNGLSLTLDTIESGIVRPIWNDPRLHYAFNCGAVGCPNLGKEAYQAEVLNEQLNAAAVNFINDPRGVTTVGAQVTLSKIFFWYSDDFGDDVDELTTHLLQFANPRTMQIISQSNGRFNYAYDWSLNEAK